MKQLARRLVIASVAVMLALLPAVVAAQETTPTATSTSTPAATGTATTTPDGTTTPAATSAPSSPTPDAGDGMIVTARLLAPVGSEVVFDFLSSGANTIEVCATATTTGPLVEGTSLLAATLPPECGQGIVDCVIFSPEHPGPCVRMTVDGEQFALFGFQPGVSIDLGTLRPVIIVADIQAPETGAGSSAGAGRAPTRALTVLTGVGVALIAAGVMRARRQA